MSILQLLVSPSGRIRRRDWWWGCIGLFAAVTLLEFAGHQVLTGKPPQSYFDDSNGWMTLQPEPYNLLQWALMVLWAWPTLAVSIKRWHDRDRPAWLAVVIVLINYAVIFLQGSEGIATWMFYTIMVLVALVLNVWQLVECGFLEGIKGPNIYGPSPKGIDTAEDVF